MPTQSLQCQTEEFLTSDRLHALLHFIQESSLRADLPVTLMRWCLMAPNLISMFVAQKILTCILSSIKESLRPVEGFLWNWSSLSSWLYSGSSSLLEGITAESNSRAACGCSYNKGRTQWLEMYYRLLNSPEALWHIHRGVQMFVTLVYSETRAHRRVTEEHEFTASSMMNARICWVHISVSIQSSSEAVHSGLYLFIIPPPL